MPSSVYSPSHMETCHREKAPEPLALQLLNDGWSKVRRNGGRWRWWWLTSHKLLDRRGLDQPPHLGSWTVDMQYTTLGLEWLTKSPLPDQPTRRDQHPEDDGPTRRGEPRRTRNSGDNSRIPLMKDSKRKTVLSYFYKLFRMLKYS